MCVSLPIYARRPVILTSYLHRCSRVNDLKLVFVCTASSMCKRYVQSARHRVSSSRLSVFVGVLTVPNCVLGC